MDRSSFLIAFCNLPHCSPILFRREERFVSKQKTPGLFVFRFSTKGRWKARSLEVQIREYHNLTAHQINESREVPVSEGFGKCLVVLGKTYSTSANFLQQWAALHLRNTIHVDSRDAGGYSVIGSSVLHGGLLSCAFSNNHGSSATVQNGCSYFKGNDPIGDRPIFYWSLNYGKQADHFRSCFWHPVRAQLWGNQTTTLRMLTPVTPGWGSSCLRGGTPQIWTLKKILDWCSFPLKTFPTKIFWTDLNS